MVPCFRSLERTSGCPPRSLDVVASAASFRGVPGDRHLLSVHNHRGSLGWWRLARLLLCMRPGGGVGGQECSFGWLLVTPQPATIGGGVGACISLLEAGSGGLPFPADARWGCHLATPSLKRPPFRFSWVIGSLPAFLSWGPLPPVSRFGLGGCRDVDSFCTATPHRSHLSPT